MNKTTSYLDHSIAYRDIGKGPTVVLIHGLSEDSDIWNKQVASLQDNYRLIIPDLPGSGLSDLLTDVSMDAMAAAVKHVLDTEEIQDAVFIGHSMGGYVMLAFAENYPEKVRAIGLFHSSSYADSEERKAARRKNISFIGSHGSLEYLKQSMPVLFGDEYKKSNPEIVYDLVQKYKDFKPSALIAYLEAMMLRPDRTSVLKQFVKPVLFIIGKQDNAIPFEDSMQQSHLPSLSYIHILDNAGHMGMIEEADKSNSILVAFLRDAC